MWMQNKKMFEPRRRKRVFKQCLYKENWKEILSSSKIKKKKKCWHYFKYGNNQQDAIYRLIYYSKSVLHVSGDVFAHHQEHLTLFTVSVSVHPSYCRLASRMN